LWVLRPGAHWCDLPERYGNCKTVHKRFSRWCHDEVWEPVFEALTADRDNQYLMIDSTIVRAHQQAANGKGGRKIKRWCEAGQGSAAQPWNASGGVSEAERHIITTHRAERIPDESQNSAVSITYIISVSLT